MAVIKLLHLRSKFTLHCLLCENGYGPFKYCAFVSWHMFNFDSRGHWRDMARRIPIPSLSRLPQCGWLLQSRASEIREPVPCLVPAVQRASLMQPLQDPWLLQLHAPEAVAVLPRPGSCNTQELTTPSKLQPPQAWPIT